MTTWKRIERQIAEMLGGERVPVTGRQRGSAPDIEHEVFSIEVKHRAGFPPHWLEDALKQAEASAKLGQLPIAIWHGKNRPIKESIVMLRLADFQDWYGK